MKGYWSLRKINSNCYKEAIWSFKNFVKHTFRSGTNLPKPMITASPPGKYRIISEIIENHPTHTVEDLKDKSMAELKDMLTNGIGKDNGEGKK